MNTLLTAARLAPPAAPRSRGNVLLVDDDPDLREANLMILGEAGFSVSAVASGEGCLARLRSELPEVILLDIDLPDLSGRELCERIKTTPATAGVAIIHLSGNYTSSEEQAQGLESGADGYITRPISNHELIARLDTILRVKRTEAELHRLTGELQTTTQALQQIMDHSLDVICTLDAEGRFAEVSAAAQKLWGYSSEEMIGQLHLELVHPEDRARTVEAAAAIMAGEPTRDFENRYCCRDGSIVWMMWSANWSPAEEMMFCVARNVTERRQREQKLREAQAVIHEQAALLDSAQEAIFVQDLRGNISFWNKSASQTYGRPAAEMIGRPFVPGTESSQAQHEEAWRQVLAEGDWIGEFLEQTQDGRELVIEGHWTLVREADGTPKSVLCINTDITERKKLEEQFLRSQRLENIGTLAGGIAHDLNNVLAPIVMAIEVLGMLHEDAPTRELLQTLKTNAERGADMVRQVLSFARGVEVERLLVQPRHLLQEVQKIARDTFPKNIGVEILAAPDLWNVLGDTTQLHQVLLNLCLNARDALPRGGHIVMTAENIVLDANYAAMDSEAKPGPHVVLQVQDDGIGMKPATLEKAFDPFFTTKEVGKGTGLGLSTSLAIIKSHGGFIRVASEPGQGTSFKVHLPADCGAVITGAPLAVAKGGPSVLPRGHGELIMVIDDEPAIRTTTQRTLELFGYRCLLAHDGADAIALYARQRSQISAVITDMLMPVMDGPSTIQVLRRLNPALPIIAVSGSTAHREKAVALEGTQFLNKPYTTESLLKMLRQAFPTTPKNHAHVS